MWGELIDMPIDTTWAASSESAVLDAVREIVGTAGAGKVFGTPITQNGMIVLPAAKVSGGIGGGTGRRPGNGGQEGTGLGGGVGLVAKPLGVFVIKDGSVSWRPAVDVNKVILGGQIIAVVAMLTLRVFRKQHKR